MTGVCPPPVIYGEPLPLFDSNRGANSSPRDTYGLGGRPALRDPCRPSAAGCLELVSPGPGQTDFGRIDISTVKDALESYMMTPIPGNPPYQRIWAGKSSCRAAVCVPFPRNF